ncbi:acyltransferase family protein [Granulicella arctica]|uniref:acyltransferase family protein n=1 Tax=Granulicella arctica TaxID=940613 RepID=UPI0021DF492C|nr:acyltransferase [Granulicella arctica]
MPAVATNPNRSWSRLDGVDLLRGLAIFFVLMNHVNMRLLGTKVPYAKGLPDQLVSSLVWNGQYGVQIFFAISGFLITSTTLRRWGSVARVSICDFYLLRFARIGPLLLLLLAILSTLHLAHVDGFIVGHKTGGLGRALFAALTFHINLLEAHRGYLPPSWDILWSLSVEEMFYLFFPLACRLFRRERFLVVPLLLFVALGPIARSHLFNHNPVWREYSYLGGMDAIALGCLTALFLAGRHLSRTAVRLLCGCGVAVLVFSLGFSLRAYAWGLGHNGLDMTILAVGTCMVIAAAAESRWRAPRLLAPLRIVGQRSYEIYLTHIFAVLGLFSLFLAAGKPMRAVPALFLAVLIVGPLLGYLVARIYSEPINRRLRARWNDGPRQLGSVVDSGQTAPLD